MRLHPTTAGDASQLRNRNSKIYVAQSDPFTTGISNIVCAIGPTLSRFEKKKPSPFNAGKVNINPAATGQAVAGTTINIYNRVPPQMRSIKDHTLLV
jgi:hypothetical protein